MQITYEPKKEIVMQMRRYSIPHNTWDATTGILVLTADKRIDTEEDTSQGESPRAHDHLLYNKGTTATQWETPDGEIWILTLLSYLWELAPALLMALKC